MSALAVGINKRSPFNFNQQNATCFWRYAKTKIVVPLRGKNKKGVY